MNKMRDLVVIGAGPAGLSAAAAAGEQGIETLVLDNALHPGGQYFKHHPQGKLATKRGALGLEDFRKLLASAGMTVRSGTLVWNLQPETQNTGFILSVQDPKREITLIRTKKVIVAAGAIERVLPFRDWTLPGVITSGAAQVLATTTSAIFAKRVLVYGTGPLLWPAVQQLAAAGAQILAVLERNSFPWRVWKMIPFALRQRERLKEGWEYIRTFQEHRIPVHWGAEVHSAQGNGRLETVTFSISQNAHLYTLPVDYLVTGFGLLPSSQLLQIAGCRSAYDPYAGFHVAIRDRLLETSVHGLFATGDGVNIMGKDAAVLEGRLAGYSAAGQLGSRIPETQVETLIHELKSQRLFTRKLNEIFPFPRDAMRQIPDETILCRCEQVTLGDVRMLFDTGWTDPSRVKALTRLGMGRCQGRFCTRNLEDLIMQVSGFQTGQGNLLRLPTSWLARPPVLPVSVDTIIQEVKKDA